MNTKGFLIPAGSFALAIALSLVAGPSRAALSRQAGGATPCPASCQITQGSDSQFVIVTRSKRADFKRSNPEFVETIKATTGNVGSVTVSVTGWSLQIESHPAGNQGGGGSQLRATVRIGGDTGLINRTIAYGAGSLPLNTTINGTGSATVSGLPTCTSLTGNCTWDLSAFAVYISPNAKDRAIGAAASTSGWSCAAQ